MLIDYIYIKTYLNQIVKSFLYFLEYSRKSWPLRAEGIRPNYNVFTLFIIKLT